MHRRRLRSGLRADWLLATRGVLYAEENQTEGKVEDLKGDGKMEDFLTQQEHSFADQSAEEAGHRFLGRFLVAGRNVGDLLKLDYGEATVLIHDHMRQAVGGIPLGCFLLATRVEPGSLPNPTDEDTFAVLLRVLGPAALPNASETDVIRFTIGQRVAQETLTWDSPERADEYSLHLLRYSGLRCRVLGTFSVKRISGRWSLSFGSDLSNFYSGRGMKVYKPDGDALDAITNFARPYGVQRHPLAGNRIAVGRVRYASSEREGEASLLMRVSLDPTDLLARRTALFGMSRTGKSNTTKIIAASIFKLREHDPVVGRVGQLILDPNGEYANDNAIDRGSLRGVASGTTNADADDVVTYGLHPHPRDPKRKLVKLNFLGTNPSDWRNRDSVVEALTPLIEGKAIVDEYLQREKAKYITAFRNVSLRVPELWDDSARTRYQRSLAAYRAILVKAGFEPPRSLAHADLRGLTNGDLRNGLNADYSRLITLFSRGTVSWDEAYDAMDGLRKAIADASGSGYATFNSAYQQNHDGRDWHDTEFINVLAIMEYSGGARMLGQLAEQHSPETTRDYADEIVTHLQAGRLVIVDQSTGDPEMNRAAAERLMWAIFEAQKAHFTNPETDEHGDLELPKDIMVFVEEAHNLLPAGSDDLSTVWSRTAKEGSKYRIGLVYATQEPSSIQPNILKNTDNWFVAHLNNSDEVKELRKYYDFDDFTQQILMVPEPGFVRMRTLSNPYIVPVQIDEFTA